ncbi:MAG: Twin-arginine translocation protein TatB [Candidatus Acidoferrum typicum]|nr:Twin-arginine translocation protein TatB [Candidatus Acidoferrum typicum]
MIVVFVIVLVVFGPQKLPELARGLGKLMAEFRKASTDFKSAFEEEMRDLERQARETERRKAEAAAASSSAQTQPVTLATPSGAETQAGGGELATGARAREAEAGEIVASEGPVVAPVAEGNIARGTENETPNAPDASEGSEVVERQDLQAKAQKLDS